MTKINELGKDYELREIAVIKTYAIKNSIIGVAKCPYDGQDVSFYIKGSACITSCSKGDKFGARYCINGKYYARAAKPL